MALPADGQNANDLTKVTEIPAGKELIFFDPTTNEGGIITLENLTKQILNGLTKQTFALDAGRQTILQALNTLNSDCQFSNKILKIKEYTADTLPIDYPIGISMCANDSNSYGYPLGYSTIVTIKCSLNRSVQFYSTYNGEIGVRMDTTNGTWSDWKTLL